MRTTNVSLELLDHELLIMRITPGIQVTNEVVTEVFDAMSAERLQGPLSVVLVLPDDLDFDPQVVSTDHRSQSHLRLQVRVLAVVAASRMAECMVELHFAYFPSSAAARCFRELNEACAWAMQTGSHRSVA